MMMTFILISIFSSFISSLSQILLILASKEEHRSWIFEYLNVKVICAYVIFFAATLLTVYCYKVIPLSIGAMLEAIGYVFVTVLGYIILKEKVTKQKIIGMILVIAGVITVAV